MSLGAIKWTPSCSALMLSLAFGCLGFPGDNPLGAESELCSSCMIFLQVSAGYVRLQFRYVSALLESKCFSEFCSLIILAQGGNPFQIACDTLLRWRLMDPDQFLKTRLEFCKASQRLSGDDRWKLAKLTEVSK